MTVEPLNSPSLQAKALLGLVLVVTVLFAAVLSPMSGAISWAMFIAIVFSSLQERSAHALHGKRGWAAFATLVVIVVSVLLPLALLTVSVTCETTSWKWPSTRAWPSLVLRITRRPMNR